MKYVSSRSKKALFLVILLATITLFPVIKIGLKNEISSLTLRAHFGCLIHPGTDSVTCLDRYFAEQTRMRGATDAMSELRADATRFPEINSGCHQLAHVIGRTAAANGASLGELFSKGDPFCWSGYYHGAVEGTLRGRTLADLTPAVLDATCASIPNTTDYFDFYNCRHGLGHALMFVSNNDLPGSLARCGELATPANAHICANAVFMENVISTTRDHKTKYLSSDPYYPCDIVDGQWKKDCYLVQTSHMFALVGGDTGRVFALCAALPEAEFRPDCRESIGRDISQNTNYDAIETATLCHKADDPAAERSCITGAVRNFMAYHRGTKEAEALCGLFPANSQVMCKAEISLQSAYYTGETERP